MENIWKSLFFTKLIESQAIVDQRKEQQVPNLNRNNLRSERWITDSTIGRGVKTPLFYAHNIEQDGRYRYNYKQLLQSKNLSISE